MGERPGCGVGVGIGIGIEGSCGFGESISEGGGGDWGGKAKGEYEDWTGEGIGVKLDPCCQCGGDHWVGDSAWRGDEGKACTGTGGP